MYRYSSVCRKSPAPLPSRYSPALRLLVMGMLTKDAASRTSAADAVRSAVLRERCGELLAAAARASTSACSVSSSGACSSASSGSCYNSGNSAGAYNYNDDGAGVVKLPQLVSSPTSVMRQPRYSAPSEMPAGVREPEPLPSRRPARRNGRVVSRHTPVTARSAPASRLPTPLTEVQRKSAIAHFIDEQATRVGLTGHMKNMNNMHPTQHHPRYSEELDNAALDAAYDAPNALPPARKVPAPAVSSEKMAAANPVAYGRRVAAVREEKIPLAPMMQRGAPAVVAAVARPAAGRGNSQPRGNVVSAGVAAPVTPFSAAPAKHLQQQQQQQRPPTTSAAPNVRYYPCGLEGGPPRAVATPLAGGVVGGVETGCPAPLAPAAPAPAPLDRQFNMAAAEAAVARPPFNHRDDMQRKVEARVHQATADVRARQLTPGFAAVRAPPSARYAPAAYAPTAPATTAAAAAARARPMSSRPMWLQSEGNVLSNGGGAHRAAGAGATLGVGAAPGYRAAGATPASPPSQRPSQPPLHQPSGGGDLGQLLAANARGAAGVQSGWKYGGNDQHGVAGVMNHAGRPRSRMVSAF